MAEIPYYFSTPVPKYFREKGLFKNFKNVAFVTWCFERCSPDQRNIFHDNQLISLKPYQFIFGRSTCCEETGLTDDEVRTQQKRWENHGFLKKAPNKTPNRFTIYEWSMKAFLKHDPQQNARQTPNKPPTNPHNLEDKNIRNKEDLPPLPPSLKMEEEEEIFSLNTKKELTHIFRDVSLNAEELAECVAVKGSVEEVQRSIEHICRHGGKRHTIRNWAYALTRWEIPEAFKSRSEENTRIANELVKKYPHYKSCSAGIMCRIYNDKVKDQKSLVFESDNPYMPVWHAIPLSDPNFAQKVTDFQSKNKMSRGSTKPLKPMLESVKSV
jgi:hypothetical protein